MPSRRSRTWIGVALAVGVVTLMAARYLGGGPAIVLFEGIEGPAESTALEARTPTSWRLHRAGERGRLAVLLTDTTSSWLGIAHGLKSIGVPFRITRDHEEALLHRVVLVYPTISGRVLSPEALRALARFPESGGTLIGVNVEGGGLGPVFGFTDAVPSRKRSQLIFDTTNAIAGSFTHDREIRIPFSNPSRGELAAGSIGYMGAVAPLATFDDGTAAITARSVGRGDAYAFGIDPGFLILRGYGNREEGVSRSYVNDYEPALDVLLRTLLGLYEAGQPGAVTLHTVPDGKDLAALITHDVDYRESLANVEVFSRYEASANLPATYFIQAKYLKDWNDDAFLDPEGVSALNALPGRGMEIASHSVAHSLQFNEAPVGTGQESYPTYRPFVRDQDRTEGATVLGELRVSRFLLQALVPGVSVVSFRPGHLRNPYSLPEALDAAGYRFSSSVTAGNSLTHLPFQLTAGRGADTAVPVFEFPVTVEDEGAPALEDRIERTVALAERLGEYGGLFVVLIHTDDVEKLEFEKTLVDAIRDDAWFGTVSGFGSFWAGRDRVQVDLRVFGARIEVALEAPDPVDGLTLRIPPGYRVTASVPQDVVRASTKRHVVLDGFVGEAIVTLTRTGG